MRLPASLDTSLAALAVPDLFPGETRISYRCVDGLIGLRDIARAAGCSAKDARRGIGAYVARHEEAGLTDAAGAVLNVTEDDVPPEGVGTRAQVAAVIAERIGLGRFGLQKRIAARKAAAPRKEARVAGTSNHPWVTGKNGRSVHSVDGGFIVARVQCQTAGCKADHEVRFRQLPAPDIIDQKFRQQGWDPKKPRCARHSRNPLHAKPKEASMATTAPKTSQAAIAAQAKMFGLLQTHFDADEGCYRSGYSDAKIAAETGLAVELVAGVRSQAFGDLKEPDEVAQLASDIEALSSLIDEQVAPLRTELASLRSKLADVRRKFSA